MGDRIQYRIRYANTCAQSLTNIRILSRLPEPLDFVEAPDGHHDEQTREIAWSLNTLQAGEVGETTFVARLGAAASRSKHIECVATMECTETEPVRVTAEPLTTRAPELTLRHEVSTADAAPGDVLLHTLDYECLGSSVVPRARLIAEIPPSCEFVSATAGGKVDRRGKTVKWPLGTLQPGMRDSVLFTVRVSDVLPTGTTIAQSRSRIDARDLGKPIECIAPKTKLHATATLQGQLTPSSQQVAPGERVTLRLTVTNTGNTHAQNVQATLRSMGKTRIVAPSNGRLAASGATEWSLGDVHAGANATLEWDVELDTPFPPGQSTLEPVVSIAGVGMDTVVARAPDIQVDAQPVLRVALETDRAHAAPGELLSYHARIANMGTANARSVVATLEIPEHVELVSDQSSGQYRASKRDVVHRIATLPVGTEEEFDVTVRLNDTFPAGTTELQAKMRGSSPNAPTAQSDVVTTSVDAESLVQFELAPSADTVQPGEGLRFQARANNAGQALVEGMTVRIPLPDGLTITGKERGLTHDKKTDSLLWSVGNVRAQQQSTIGFEARIEPRFPAGENRLVLDTDVQWTGGSLQETSKPIQIVAHPALAMALSCPGGAVAPGDPFRINIRFQNEGNARASECVLALTVDPRATITTTSTHIRVDQGNVQVDIGSLNPNESGSLQLEGIFASEFPAGQTAINASATLRCQENVSVEAQAMLGTVSAASKMTLGVAVDDRDVRAGDTLTFRVECANGGNSPTGPFTVECDLPEFLTALESTGGDTHTTDDVIQWAVQDLAAGQTLSLMLKTQTAPLFAEGDTALQIPFALIGNEETQQSVSSPLIKIRAQPVLEIQLEATPTTAAPGDVVRYQSLITNSGSADARNVAAVLALPDYVEPVAAQSTGQYSATKREITLRIPTLVAGDKESFEVSTQLNDTFPAGTTELVAQTDVTAPNAESVQSNRVVVAVDATADVQLTLTPNVETASPGDRIQFVASASNTGQALVQDLTVRIPLSEGLTVKANDRGFTRDRQSGELLWTLGDMRSKQETNAAFTVQVEAAFPAGESQLSLDLNAAWEAGTTHKNSTPIRIVATPTLAIELRESTRPAQPGDSLQVPIRVHNKGNAMATGCTLTLSLPPGVKPMNTHANAACEHDRVVFTIKDLGPGETESLRFDGGLETAFPAGETPVTVHALFQCAEGADTEVDATVATVTAASKVAMTVSVDRTDAQPGDTLSFRVDCKNHGNASHKPLTVRAIIPDEIQVITASGGDERTRDEGVQWLVHELPPGGSATLGVVCRLVESFPAGKSVLQFPVELLADEGVLNTTLSPSLTVNARPVPVITLSMDSEILPFEQPTRLLVTVTNEGNAPATNATLELSIPKGLSCQGVSDQGVLTPKGRIIRWTIPCLDVGTGTQDRWIDIIPEGAFAPGLNQNAATASLKGHGFDVIKSEKLPLLIDAQSNIALETTFSPTHALPGEPVVVTIRYQNVGHAEAERLQIVNPLPPRTEFVGASNKGVFDDISNAVHWTIKHLPAGASGECQLTLQLDTEFPNGHTTITNSCTANADQNPVALSEEQSVTIQAVPTVTASLEANRDSVRPGDELAITVSCYADGSAPASDVMLDLVIPPFVTIQESSTEGVLNPETGCIRWALGMMRPGQTFASILKLKLDAIIPPGVEDLPLSLQANSEETGLTEGTVCAVRVDSAPDLILHLSGDATEASPEDTFLVDVHLINQGTTDCSGVVVTLPLPSGLQAALEQNMGEWIIEESGLRWDVGPLAVGAQCEQPLQLRVIPDFPAGHTPITLSARATSIDGTAGGSYDHEMTILAVPRLHVSTKASPEIASLGEDVLYTFTIENVGKASARAVRAVGHLPEGLALKKCSNDGVIDPATPNQVTWMIPALEIAECLELTVEAAMNLQSATITTSMAGHLELSSPDLTDRVIGQRVAVDLDQGPEQTVTTQLVVVGHDVAWGDSGTRTVHAQPGQTIPMEMVVTHTSTDSIERLLGTLSTEGTLVEFTSPEEQAEMVSPQALTWALSDLAGSGTRRLQMLVTLNTVMPAGVHHIPVQALVSTPDGLECDDAVSLMVTAAPEVSLTLSTDRTEISPGDEFTLTVQYKVSGSADANDLMVSLPLPKGCTPLEVSDGGEIIKTRQAPLLRWTPGLSSVGDEGLLRCQVQLDPKVFDEETTVQFEASATADALKDITCHPMSLAVLPKPLLALTVTADRADTIPGERIGYTLRVENVGFSTIKGVTLSNPLPPRCRYASGTEGGTYDELADAVVWTLPAIASGGSVSVGWTADLDVDFPYGETVLTNMVVARIGDDEPIESDDVSTRVLSEPTLEGELSVEPQRARPGDRAIGTISWKNTGTAYADRAKALVKLPKGLQAVSASDEGQIQRKGAAIQWKIPSIDTNDDGQVSFELAVDKTFQPGETTLGIDLTLNARNATATETRTEIVVESSARLDLQATVDTAEASPGGLLRYTLSWANRGEVPATQAIVHFPLPELCTVLHCNKANGLQQSDRALMWHYDILKPGVSETVEIQLQITSDMAAGETQIVVTPTLQADSGLAADDLEPLTTLVHAAAQVRASVTVDQHQAIPGEDLTVHLVLANDGDAEAHSTGLLFPLPPRLDFVGSDGAPVRYQRAKRIVEFVAGDLAPGQELVATIRTQLEASFPAGETALSLRGRYGVEGGAAEWTDTVECVVTALPALTPEIGLEHETARPGDSLRCKARVVNEGNAIAKNSVLLALLPEHLTLVDARGGVFDGVSRTVTWPIKKLDVGTSREFPFVVQLTGKFQAGSTQLPIHLETSGDHLESNTAETSLWVDASPKLLLEMDTDVDEATPNSDIRYLLSLRNDGNASAEGVSLQLTLPARAVLLDGGPDAIHETSAGTVQWPLDHLETGETFDVAAAVRLAESFPAGTTTLAARASVRANNASASPDASLEIPVNAAPALDITPTLECDDPQPGTTFTTELLWRNSGDASATNASLACQMAPYTRATKVSTGGEIDRHGVATWKLGNVPAGASGKVTVELSVAKEVPPGDHNLSPTIMVTANELPREQRALPSLIFEASSDLVVEVTSETSVATADIGTRVSARTTGSDNQVAQEKTQEVTIGALISFQLNIANRGNAAADDTEIRHDLPKGAVFVSATNNGLYDATQHCVVWQLGRVSAGQEGLTRTTVVRFGG